MYHKWFSFTLLLIVLTHYSWGKELLDTWTLSDKEASYLQQHLGDFNNFEKSAAFKGIKQGNVIHRGGGNMFIFYKHSSPVGYNNGKLTNWMRIEITSGTIHSHPADPSYAQKKLGGCG